MTQDERWRLERCETCRFRGPQVPDFREWWTCRRYAPHPAWALVRVGDWCGEWEERLPVEPIRGE